MQQSEARDSGEECARIEFQRTLPEALPVDDPRAVAEVEDVASIERAMHQVRSARLCPRLRQHPDQLCGGGSPSGICSDHVQARGPDAPAFHNMSPPPSASRLYT